MRLRRLTSAVAVAACIGAAAPAGAQAPARWQLTLRSSEILYEIRLLRLEDDALVVRQGEATLELPLRDISQLQLVRPSYALPGSGGRRAGIRALTGADDLVFEMTLLDVRERRSLVERILQTFPAESS